MYLVKHHMPIRLVRILTNIGKRTKFNHCNCVAASARKKSTIATNLYMKANMADFSQEQIQAMRKPYRGKQEVLDVDSLVSRNPIEQFRAWFNEAASEGNGIYEANAMTIATASKEGRPSCRMVLLKGFDEQGFKFYTNYNSRKGKELAENPWASLLFYWTVNVPDLPSYARQVRIEGSVEKLSEEESDAYFHSRPVSSQIGAVVSHQGSVIQGRHVLDAENSRLEEKYLNSEEQIPRPSEWGGFRVKPEVYEFWQGQTNRLHDRLVFRRPRPDEKIDPNFTDRAENGWVLERLSP